MHAPLADLILIVHFSFAAFIVIGLVLIWLGYLLGWGFVRNFYFRLAHLLAIGFVLLETVAGIICPLTTWEAMLRELAGQENVYSGSFMSYWLGSLLYYDLPPGFFISAYAVIFILVLLAIFVVKPELPRRS